MFGKVLGPPETVMGNTAKMLLLCCWQSDVLRSHMVLFMTVWNSFTLSAISKQWTFSNEREAGEKYASQVRPLIFWAWNFVITGCNLDQNKLLKRFWFQIIWNPHLESISGSFTLCQVIVALVVTNTWSLKNLVNNFPCFNIHLAHQRFHSWNVVIKTSHNHLNRHRQLKS